MHETTSTSKKSDQMEDLPNAESLDAAVAIGCAKLADMKGETWFA